MIYLDLWNNEYVKEKEVTAPPERYLTYLRGIEEGIYIEKYRVSSNPLKKLIFAYTEAEKIICPEVVARKRNSHLKEHNASGATLVEYVIPPAIYDSIEKAVEKSKNDFEG